MRPQISKNDLSVPTADSADNTFAIDVIGNKTDTTGGDSIVSLAKQIVEDTGTTLPTTVDEIPSESNSKTFNATALQSIQDEAEDALEGENLDHFVKTAVDTDLATTVADNSALGYTLATSAVSNFDRTTDSLEAIGTKTSSSDSSGTFSYLDAGGEQDVVEITNTTRKIIHGVWLDLTNMTQDGTIKAYYKIDGTNYREFMSQSFTVATDSDGIYLNINAGITEDFKITYEEGADEGAARNLPYSIIYEVKE